MQHCLIRAWKHCCSSFAFIIFSIHALLRYMTIAPIKRFFHELPKQEAQPGYHMHACLHQGEGGGLHTYLPHDETT